MTTLSQRQVNMSVAAPGSPGYVLVPSASIEHVEISNERTTTTAPSPHRLQLLSTLSCSPKSLMPMRADHVGNHISTATNTRGSVSILRPTKALACKTHFVEPDEKESEAAGFDCDEQRNRENAVTQHLNADVPSRMHFLEPQMRPNRTGTHTGHLIGSPHPSKRRLGTSNERKRYRPSPAVLCSSGNSGNEDSDEECDEEDEDYEIDEVDQEDKSIEEEKDDDGEDDDENDEKLNKALFSKFSSPVLLQCAREPSVASILEPRNTSHSPLKSNTKNTFSQLQRRRSLAFADETVPLTSPCDRITFKIPPEHDTSHKVLPVCDTVSSPTKRDLTKQSYTPQCLNTMRSAPPRRAMSFNLPKSEAFDPCSTWADQWLEVDDELCAYTESGDEKLPDCAFVRTAPVSRQSYSLRHGMHSPYWRTSSTPGHSVAPFTPAVNVPEQDKTEELGIVAERLLLHQEDEQDESEHASSNIIFDSDNDDCSVHEEPLSPRAYIVPRMPRCMSFHRDSFVMPRPSAAQSVRGRSVHASVVPVPRACQTSPSMQKPSAYEATPIAATAVHDHAAHKYAAPVKPCVKGSCIAVADGHLHAPAMASVDCQSVEVGSPPPGISLF